MAVSLSTWGYDTLTATSLTHYQETIIEELTRSSQLYATITKPGCVMRAPGPPAPDSVLIEQETKYWLNHPRIVGKIKRSDVIEQLGEYAWKQYPTILPGHVITYEGQPIGVMRHDGTIQTHGPVRVVSTTSTPNDNMYQINFNNWRYGSVSTT